MEKGRGLKKPKLERIGAKRAYCSPSKQSLGGTGVNTFSLKKPLIALVILLIALLVFFGGYNLTKQAAVTEASEDTGLTIATSFYPIYIMALNLTKDVPGVELVNIAPPDVGCIHDIQFSTSDLKLLEKSDIFIINGLGMENYLSRVFENLPNLQVIDSTANLQLAVLVDSEHEHESDHGHANAQAHSHSHDNLNPHTWLSVSLAIEQVQEIAEKLCLLDPANKEQYTKNAAEYVAKLEALRTRMEQGLKNLSSKNIVVFQDAFAYFAEEFNLNVVAVVQGDHGSELSARELAQAIEKIQENEVKAIFISDESRRAAAETIAKETAAKVYLLNPATSGPLDADSYLQAMEQNLQTLREALAE